MPTPDESWWARLWRWAGGPVPEPIEAAHGVSVSVKPGQITRLRTTNILPTSVSLAWNAPATGTQPIYYTVFFKLRTSATWSIGAASITRTAATITGLKPSTLYDVQIIAHN